METSFDILRDKARQFELNFSENGKVHLFDPHRLQFTPSPLRLNDCIANYSLLIAEAAQLATDISSAEYAADTLIFSSELLMSYIYQCNPSDISATQHPQKICNHAASLLNLCKNIYLDAFSRLADIGNFFSEYAGCNFHYQLLASEEEDDDEIPTLPIAHLPTASPANKLREIMRKWLNMPSN